MLPKIYDGTGQPAPEKICLRAGKLSVQFENGTLRYLCLGSREILRGIYATDLWHRDINARSLSHGEAFIIF